MLEADAEEVCQQAGAPLLAASSIKAGLDVDWNDSEQKADALDTLCRQLDRLAAWVARRKPRECEDSPLSRYVEAPAQVRQQDLEPRKGGGVQIPAGRGRGPPSVHRGRPDEAWSEEQERAIQRLQATRWHGIDTDLIIACAVTRANRPEEEATPELESDMSRLRMIPDELFIDRAYLNSSLAENVARRGGQIVCKPLRGGNANSDLFAKRDFKIKRTRWYDHLPCRPGRGLRARPGGGSRPRGLRTLLASRAMYSSGVREGGHRDDGDDHP